MKILLTGATGFLGFRTLEKLIHLDYVDSIIATGRQIKNTHFIEHSKVHYVLGELGNETFVDELVQQVDHIIHVAALSSPWGKSDQFHNANVITQENLIKSALKYTIDRIIYISTPSIYFELKDKFNIKESDKLPNKFINEYALTKRKAEILLEKSKIPYVILRPRALTGRGDTVIMPRLIRAYDEGKLRVIGNGENVVDLTSVSNVVDAIILGLKTSHGINNTYNISNGNPVKLWNAISSVLHKLGKIPPTKKIPFQLVKVVSILMETKSRMTNMEEPVLTKYGVGTLAKSFTMDISKAKKLLGYEPKITIEEAIDEFIDWYKANEKS